MQNYSFDLQRILLGELPMLFIVEIALRTSIMLLYLLFLLRLLGTRSLAQFSLFEFVLIIALGSAVGDPMFYPEIPVLHGIVVITVVVLLERLLIWVTNRSHKMEDILEGSAQCLVDAGRFNVEGMNRASLSRNEIYMKLRLAGVEQLGQVKRSYLELNGEMSIFLFPAAVVRPVCPYCQSLKWGKSNHWKAPTRCREQEIMPAFTEEKLLRCKQRNNYRSVPAASIRIGWKPTARTSK